MPHQSKGYPKIENDYFRKKSHNLLKNQSNESEASLPFCQVETLDDRLTFNHYIKGMVRQITHTH